MIGYFENLEIHELEVPIQPLDRIILWTDGLADGVKPGNNEVYGEERFFNSIRNQINLSVDDSASSILRDSIDWLEGDNPTDDLTLVLIDID